MEIDLLIFSLVSLFIPCKQRQADMKTAAVGIGKNWGGAGVQNRWANGTNGGMHLHVTLDSPFVPSEIQSKRLRDSACPKMGGQLFVYPVNM